MELNLHVNTTKICQVYTCSSTRATCIMIPSYTVSREGQCTCMCVSLCTNDALYNICSVLSPGSGGYCSCISVVSPGEQLAGGSREQSVSVPVSPQLHLIQHGQQLLARRLSQQVGYHLRHSQRSKSTLVLMHAYTWNKCA